jgi:two-component system, NarL family, response regulator LiaR
VPAQWRSRLAGYHPRVHGETGSKPRAWRQAWRSILFYGLGGGLLVAGLRLTEYRFLVVEHSLEIYGGLVAATFAGLGIWMGSKLDRRRAEPAAAVGGVPGAPGAPGALFVADAERQRSLGITPREMEILGLIASGLSNREIGERLFVSENTVKTHSSRLFDKLGAKRRTQAVHLAKEMRLIP